MSVDKLVENSYYEHKVWGRVKLVSVDETMVAFQVLNEQTTISTTGQDILKGRYEAVSEFMQQVEPADVTVSAEPAALNLGAFDT